ncbi:MAG: hypothetical protein RL148_1700 [Planctomycetota bacterium]
MHGPGALGFAYALATLLCCTPPAPAQAPTADACAQVPASLVSSPLGRIGCSTMAAAFDVTNSVSPPDTRVLGVAAVQVPGAAGPRTKWFVSRANGTTNGAAAQQVSVFDGDLGNAPDASTYRTLPRAPSMVMNSLWGHRDGEGVAWTDSVTNAPRAATLWGDEGGNLHVLDAATEHWVGTVPLTGFAGTATGSVVRAIAARPFLGTAPDERMLVYVSDFASGIEEWLVDLRQLTAVRTTTPVVPSPSGTYGTACFVHNGNWLLAVHHQDALTCAGTGATRITVLDLAPATLGQVVWTRSGDTALAGELPNPNGGLAGGLAFTVLNGQPCLAALQQGVVDAITFLPVAPFAERGPADCSPVLLTIAGTARAGGTLELVVLGAQPQQVWVAGFDFPPLTSTPLPQNPACTLELPVPVTTIYVFPAVQGSVARLSLALPPTLVSNFTVDAGFIVPATGAVGSSNRIDLHVDLAPF